MEKEFELNKNWLSDLRALNGWTKYRLARILDKSESAIAVWEKKPESMTMRNALLILNKTNADPGIIFVKK